MLGLAAAHRPNAPSTCSHAPDCSHRSSIGSSGSNAPQLTLPGLRADDRRARVSSARASASGSIAPWSSAATRCGGVAPEADQPQRAEDRRVRLRAGDHGERRRADQALARGVPAGALEHVVARDREAGHVGHLGAGDEADAGGRRQPEQRRAPSPRRPPRRPTAAGEPTYMCAFWSHVDGQPVGRQRGGQRAAGDEAEVARPGAGDDARVGARDELVDHLLGGRRRRRSARGRARARRASGSTGGPTGRSGSEARNASA